MTVLSVYTEDCQTYDLKTAFYADNTYNIQVTLPNGTRLDRDFVSKFDCAELNIQSVKRTGDETAEISYTSDAPGALYYGIAKDAAQRAYNFITDPTEKELM